MDEAQRAFVERRLKRRELWVTLWLERAVLCLSWFAEPTLPNWARTLFHGGLNMITRHVLMIIGLRLALQRGGVSKQRPLAHGAPCHLSRRALFGGRLRRAFKAKDIATRLERLRRAIDTLDMFVARLAHRLRRGLTRRRSLQTRVAPSQIFDRPALDLPPLAAGGKELRAATRPSRLSRLPMQTPTSGRAAFGRAWHA